MFKGKHFAATMKKVPERCFYKIPLKLHLTFTQIYWNLNSTNYEVKCECFLFAHLIFKFIPLEESNGFNYLSFNVHVPGFYCRWGRWKVYSRIHSSWGTLERRRWTTRWILCNCCGCKIVINFPLIIPIKIPDLIFPGHLHPCTHDEERLSSRGVCEHQHDLYKGGQRRRCGGGRSGHD